MCFLARVGQIVLYTNLRIIGYDAGARPRNELALEFDVRLMWGFD
jgi:hypothetical protein